MGKNKAYYKLLHEHGGLASDTIRVSIDVLPVLKHRDSNTLLSC